ncbi:MAG: hypothetical protein WCF72_19990, partial [Pseudolabrys sp.]
HEMFAVGAKADIASASQNVRVMTQSGHQTLLTADIGRRWQLRLPGNDATLYRLWPTKSSPQEYRAKLRYA